MSQLAGRKIAAIIEIPLMENGSNLFGNQATIQYPKIVGRITGRNGYLVSRRAWQFLHEVCPMKIAFMK